MNAVSYCHVWRLRNVSVKNFPCKICRRLCATG